MGTGTSIIVLDPQTRQIRTRLPAVAGGAETSLNLPASTLSLSDERNNSRSASFSSSSTALATGAGAPSAELTRAQRLARELNAARGLAATADKSSTGEQTDGLLAAAAGQAQEPRRRSTVGVASLRGISSSSAKNLGNPAASAAPATADDSLLLSPSAASSTVSSPLAAASASGKSASTIPSPRRRSGSHAEEPQSLSIGFPDATMGPNHVSTFVQRMKQASRGQRPESSQAAAAPAVTVGFAASSSHMQPSSHRASATSLTDPSATMAGAASALDNTADMVGASHASVLPFSPSSTSTATVAPRLASNSSATSATADSVVPVRGFAAAEGSASLLRPATPLAQDGLSRSRHAEASPSPVKKPPADDTLSLESLAAALQNRSPQPNVSTGFLPRSVSINNSGQATTSSPSLPVMDQATEPVVAPSPSLAPSQAPIICRFHAGGAATHAATAASAAFGMPQASPLVSVTSAWSPALHSATRSSSSGPDGSAPPSTATTTEKDAAFVPSGSTTTATPLPSPAATLPATGSIATAAAHSLRKGIVSDEVWSCSETAGRVQVWSTRSLALLWEFQLECAGIITLCAIDEYVVAGGYNGTLYFWDAATHTPLVEIAAHNDAIRTLLPLTSRHLITSSGGHDGSIALWCTPGAGRETTLILPGGGISDGRRRGNSTSGNAAHAAILASAQVPVRAYDAYGFECFVPTLADSANCQIFCSPLPETELAARNSWRKQLDQQQHVWQQFWRTSTTAAGAAAPTALDMTAVRKLVAQGVPLAQRMKLWTVLIHRWLDDAAATEPPMGARRSVYQQLAWRMRLHRVQQVELDLHRTYPTNQFFNTPTSRGYQCLRRVLISFSQHNPSTGYCQGFNFLAGFALLLLPEEMAFW